MGFVCSISLAGKALLHMRIRLRKAHAPATAAHSQQKGTNILAFFHCAPLLISPPEIAVPVPFGMPVVVSFYPCAESPPSQIRIRNMPQESLDGVEYKYLVASRPPDCLAVKVPIAVTGKLSGSVLKEALPPAA